MHCLTPQLADKISCTGTGGPPEQTYGANQVDWWYPKITCHANSRVAQSNKLPTAVDRQDDGPSSSCACCPPTSAPLQHPPSVATSLDSPSRIPSQDGRVRVRAQICALYWDGESPMTRCRGPCCQGGWLYANESARQGGIAAAMVFGCMLPPNRTAQG